MRLSGKIAFLKAVQNPWNLYDNAISWRYQPSSKFPENNFIAVIYEGFNHCISIVRTLKTLQIF